jgi:hypothetical protein
VEIPDGIRLDRSCRTGGAHHIRVAGPFVLVLAKPKKPTKAALRKKCDTLASRYYRALTPYCELAGLDGIECSGPLAWAHIVSRSVLHMRYEPYNHLILCNSGHHWFYTHNPISWVRVLEKHYPERLQLAEANRDKFAKVDYLAFLDRFTTEP